MHNAYAQTRITFFPNKTQTTHAHIHTHTHTHTHSSEYEDSPCIHHPRQKDGKPILHIKARNVPGAEGLTSTGTPKAPVKYVPQILVPRHFPVILATVMTLALR
jgi:hypothetical protein